MRLQQEFCQHRRRSHALRHLHQYTQRKSIVYHCLPDVQNARAEPPQDSREGVSYAGPVVSADVNEKDLRVCMGSHLFEIPRHRRSESRQAGCRRVILLSLIQF